MEPEYKTDALRAKLTKLGIQYTEQDSQFVLSTRVSTSTGGCKFVEHRKTGYTRLDVDDVDVKKAVAVIMMAMVADEQEDEDQEQ